MTPPDDRTVDRWAEHLEAAAAASAGRVPDDPTLSPATDDLGPQERAGLDAVAARLRDEALWSEPPTDLRSRLLAQVAQEQRGGEPGAPASGGRPRRTRWLLLAAAAVILLVGGVGGVVLRPRGPAVEFALAGSSLAPRASAQAELRPKSAGVAITLHVTGLAPAPPGSYYAAWLRGPEGVVPVGSFHWRKGGIPIELWSGVTSDRYPELFVTLQTEGAGPGPSDRVVMQGRAGP